MYENREGLNASHRNRIAPLTRLQIAALLPERCAGPSIVKPAVQLG
jgi:hypothetical protein